MYKVLWEKFVDLKIAEEYFLLYMHHSSLAVTIINAICLLMSCSGIAVWISDNLSPLPSSLIILSAQVICILQPLYPFSKRLYAARCIYNEYSSQSLKAEQMINQYLFGSLKENKLSAFVNQLQIDVSEIEGKFSSPDLFPRKMRLHKKAQKSASLYFESHFKLGEGEDYGQDDPASNTPC